MKKLNLWLLMGVMVLTLSGCSACEETFFTKLGDDIATIGKEGIDKTATLADRKAERAGKCIEQKAGEAKKKLGL